MASIDSPACEHQHSLLSPEPCPRCHASWAAQRGLGGLARAAGAKVRGPTPARLVPTERALDVMHADIRAALDRAKAPSYMVEALLPSLDAQKALFEMTVTEAQQSDVFRTTLLEALRIAAHAGPLATDKARAYDAMVAVLTKKG